jgi:hypothetical protein
MQKTTRTRLAALMAAGAAALALAGPAAADPVTYTNPGTGASVTLGSDTYAAGGRLEVSGAGFTRVQGSGRPIVAIKPDEHDEQDEVARWTAGGPDAISPIDVGGGEWVLAFAARADGTFSGWIDLPEDLPLTGAGTGAYAGRHVLRLLSGLLSTDNASPTDPNNIGVYFSSMDFGLGALSASGTFYGGSAFLAGTVLVPRGGAFAASTPLAIALDGEPYSATAITTDASGAVPASARLAIPAGAAPGRHAFSLRTGTTELTQPFTVSGAATAALGAATATQGQAIAFSGSGFVGLRGRGQKVAVALGTLGVKACVTADATGAVSGAVAVPADATTATASPVRLLAGTSCVPGGEQDDLPGRVVTLPVTVVAPAPIAQTPAPVVPPTATTPAPAPVGPVARPVTPRPGTLKRLKGGRTLTLTLGAGSGGRATITVKSSSKVRTTARAKAKVVSLTTARAVTAPAGKTTTVTLTLTPDGRRVLARHRTLKVVVRVAPGGGAAAVTRTLTLRT